VRELAEVVQESSDDDARVFPASGAPPSDEDSVQVPPIYAPSAFESDSASGGE